MKRFHVFVGCHDRGEQPAHPLSDYVGSYVMYEDALAAQGKAVKAYGFSSRWCECTILETQPDGSLKEVY